MELIAMPKQPLVFALSRLETPIGVALIATDDQGRLRVLDWADHKARMQTGLARIYRASGGVKLDQSIAAAWPVMDGLKAFFAGDLEAIDAIPVESAGTPFQRKVWAVLRKIPAGKTWTYTQLAARAGKPEAIRAAGAANGLNPISVVVPCHRVIGRDGSLTGYGGGLHRKEWLLTHEGVKLKSAA
ncbi:methylated-DNA--[protein]-cysteine S-methyltransferase [Dongia sp.]|uniref:methylated-DNA--[protein]-cysteine S-methyltransferase n=1 Tax=Dongia sp. TaxID=1977262 RepID=UPI0037517E86